MFQVIPKLTASAASVPPGEIHIQTRKTPSKSKSRPMLVFKIGGEIAAKLGFKKGEFVEIGWGADKHLGQVRLVKTAGGGRTAWKISERADGSVRVFTAALPANFGGANYDGVKVTAEVIPSSATAAPFVVVTMPKDFYRKE